jgi:hypothetical protein
MSNFTTLAMSWDKKSEVNQRGEIGVEEGTDGSDTGTLDVQGKWGDGRGRSWRDGSREGKGRLGKDLTGGLHLSGKKRARGNRSGKDRVGRCWASWPGLLGPLLLFFLFFSSFFLFFSGFLNLL